MCLLGGLIVQSFWALENLKGCAWPDLGRRVACFVEPISTPCYSGSMSKLSRGHTRFWSCSNLAWTSRSFFSSLAI